MMKYARIEDGVVSAISYVPIADWEKVDGNVFAGFVRGEAGSFSAPAKPAPMAEELKAHLAAIRFDAETGGITVGSMEIATDRESQAKLLAVRVKADVSGFSTCWKALNGWYSLNAEAICAISDAVLYHVDRCFAAERAVSEEIDAGTVSALNEIPSAFEAALLAGQTAVEDASEAT